MEAQHLGSSQYPHSQKYAKKTTVHESFNSPHGGIVNCIDKLTKYDLWKVDVFSVLKVMNPPDVKNYK